MQDYQDKILKGVLLVLFSVLMVATMAAMAKFLSGDFHPIELSFYRNLFIFVAMSCLITRPEIRQKLKTKRHSAHIFRGTVGTIGLIAGFWSLSLLPLTTSLTLYYTAPLFVILLAGPMLQEKVGIFRWLCVLIGFGGVVIVINPAAGDIVMLGLFFAFFDSLCAALTQIYLRDLGKTENSFITVYYYMGIGTVLTFFLLPFVWSGLPQSEHLLLLLGVGITGWLQQITKTKGYALAPARTTAPLQYTGIIWATIFGFVIWNTFPNILFWLGAAIIIISNLAIIWRESRINKNEQI